MALSLRACRQLQKPVCLIASSQTPAEEGARQVLAFVTEHHIQKLNVADPTPATTSRPTPTPERSLLHCNNPTGLATDSARQAESRYFFWGLPTSPDKWRWPASMD